MTPLAVPGVRQEKLMEKTLPSPDSSNRTRSRRSRGAARRAPASVTRFLRSGILFPESLDFLIVSLDLIER